MSRAGGRTYYAAFAETASGTVSDETVTSTDFHQHDCYKGCVLVVEKEAGNAAIDAKLQGYHHATGDWFDVANSDIVQITGGTAAAVRYCMIYPGATGSDADGVVVQDTNFNLVNGFLPDTFRVSLTLGGSGVSATYAATVYPLR